jgi:RNA polymerase sigma-70 factor (ECF subfamily)
MADSVVKTGVPVVERVVMRDVEDDALVEHARNGDAEAFTLLYYRYRLDVWNMAYFQLRNHHEAEDSLQETFLRAYRALGQYRRSESARPWLLTICRNVCLDRIRANRRRPMLSLDAGQFDEPAFAAADHDRRIDFRRALAQLPVDDLEAFFVVDVMGCRSEEAARILGLRASSTLRSRLARARRALAPALSDPPELAPALPRTSVA